MARAPIVFNGNLDVDPVPVELFGKTYSIRQVTKTVQKRLEDIQDRLNQAAQNDDADGDAVVAILADGIDALLAIEGQHRTPAKKVLMDRWEADKLSLTQLQQIFEGLQEEELEARPT